MEVHKQEQVRPKYIPALSTSKQDRNKKRKGKLYQSRKSLHLLLKLFLAASSWQETNTAHTVSPSKLTLTSDHLSYCSQLLFYLFVEDTVIGLTEHKRKIIRKRRKSGLKII